MNQHEKEHQTAVENLFLARLQAADWTAYFHKGLGRWVTNAYEHELQGLYRLTGLKCEVVDRNGDGKLVRVGPILTQTPGPWPLEQPEAAPLKPASRIWVVVSESFEHGEHKVAACLTREGAYTTAYGMVNEYRKYSNSHDQEDIESALKDLGYSFEKGTDDVFGGGDPSALFYVTATLCEVGP